MVPRKITAKKYNVKMFINARVNEPTRWGILLAK